MQRLPGVVFRQDNARPSTARVSQDCLLTATTPPRLVRSPYLSPIEHIWHSLGWQVWHPTNLNELEARLQQIWNKISQDIIQKFVCLNARSHRDLAFALEWAQNEIKSSCLVPFSLK
ncbi:transposable element Tcb2 transposase [Trichonephila clavipes]|nr:transposable element Tcb2 transposase [Trichonephila clavipes]